MSILLKLNMTTCGCVNSSSHFMKTYVDPLNKPREFITQTPDVTSSFNNVAGKKSGSHFCFSEFQLSSSKHRLKNLRQTWRYVFLPTVTAASSQGFVHQMETGRISKQAALTSLAPSCKSEFEALVCGNAPFLFFILQPDILLPVVGHNWELMWRKSRQKGRVIGPRGHRAERSSGRVRRLNLHK